MEAVKGIEIIELTVKSNENTFTFNPVLLIDEESVLLIDAGIPFQSEEILQAFEREGIPFSKLKTIIFTHQDLDHIGGAPSILNKGDGSIQVLAHFLDNFFIFMIIVRSRGVRHPSLATVHRWCLTSFFQKVKALAVSC
jgi:glyoxylase-like metal-dependent hydrolase (beta-lactamase superfamily II)